MGLRAFLLLDATFAMCGATFAFGVARRHSLIRHPGLDPGSIHAPSDEWIPDQVRDSEENLKEVAVVSGHRGAIDTDWR
jgi:hypothetical protein